MAEINTILKHLRDTGMVCPMVITSNSPFFASTIPRWIPEGESQPATANSNKL